MATAPMHTVRLALTNASTNPLSLALPVLIFSHCPNRSKLSSILSISPINAPIGIVRDLFRTTIYKYIDLWEV